MAKRGTKKARSEEQERYIAKMYGGRRSPSSGAALHDQGDVRAAADGTLFECKMTGEPGGEPKGGKLVTDFEKIADEAWAEGREPAVALRFWNPDSVLADPQGWVNLTVRLTNDDAVRSALIMERNGN